MLRAAITVGFLALGSVAWAQTAPPQSPNSTPSQTSPGAGAAMTPQKLLSKIHHVNEMEIRAGKLAKERGQSDEVKKFGETLVTDHGKADEKVADLAKKRGIQLGNPAAEDPGEQGEMQEHMEAMKKLESLSGEEFDHQFLKLMQDGHVKTYQMLMEQQTLIGDKDVLALIGEIAPTVKEHLETATRLLGEEDRKRS